MPINDMSFSTLDDRPLLDAAKRLAVAERRATAALLRALMEIDSRRLHLGEGCASMFVYCTRVLRLSEGGAYNRIEAARAARRWPLVLELLEESAITLTAIRLLAPHLTAENHREVLASARDKSKREIEAIVASLQPKPDVPMVVRKLPGASHAATSSLLGSASSFVGKTSQEALSTTSPTSVSVVAAPDQCQEPPRPSTASRPRVPSSDSPAPTTGHSRHIPAAVRRAVWRRDEGRCAFVGTEGRCRETAFLEFHHVVPYVARGEASVANIQLRCRAHNAHEARLFFGDTLVRESRVAWGL